MASKAKRLMDKSKQREAEAEAAVAEKAEAEAQRAQKAYDKALDELETEAGTVIRVAQALVPSPGDSAVELDEVLERIRHLNLAAQMAMGETPEHRSQVADLKRELEKAEEALRKRASELADAAKTNQGLTKELDDANARIDELSRLNESAIETIEQLEAQRDQFIERYVSAAEDLVALTVQLEDSSRAVRDEQGISTQLRQELQGLRSAAQSSDASNDPEDEAEEEDPLPEGTSDSEEPLTNADRAVNGANGGGEPSLWERLKGRNRDREERNREHESRPRHRITISREQVGS